MTFHPVDRRINKVIDGKQYNRSVRLHKLTYETLMKLAWSDFEEWLEANHAEALPKYTDTIPAMYKVRQHICRATHDAAMADESCQMIIDLLLTYLNVLRHKKGQLAAFWMTYVDMVDILLRLLLADRERDWPLHLSCIRSLIPWCVALGKINYARYFPVYYAQMSRLQETSPVLPDHIINGGFSVQLKNEHPFARISVDQTTEETVNKDTQTAGGTRGFSLKHGAVSRYYLTDEHHAGALRQLRQEISVQGSVITKYTDLLKRLAYRGMRRMLHQWLISWKTIGQTLLETILLTS